VNSLVPIFILSDFLQVADFLGIQEAVDNGIRILKERFSDILTFDPTISSSPERWVQAKPLRKVQCYSLLLSPLNHDTGSNIK
jgi:hypothetical protein